MFYPYKIYLKSKQGAKERVRRPSQSIVGWGAEDFIYLDEGKAPHWDDRNSLNDCSNLHSQNEAPADALHSKKHSASVTSLKFTTTKRINWVCGVMLACSVQADTRLPSICHLGLKKWTYQNLYEEPCAQISLKSWIIYLGNKYIQINVKSIFRVNPVQHTYQHDNIFFGFVGPWYRCNCDFIAVFLEKGLHSLN